MEIQELIDYRLFDPKNSLFKQFRREKATFTTLYCSNKNNCDAFKNGCCAMWGSGYDRCPYGKLNKEYGFSQMARGFRDWIDKKKSSVENITQLKPQQTICNIGEFIFLPYPHWNLNWSSALGEDLKSNFIHKDNFTVENFNKIVLFRPQALFGGTIDSYQKEVVPKIILHTRENLPDFYSSWEIAYPEIASKFKFMSHVGREAVVKTLKVGAILPSRYGYMVWNGTTVELEEYNSAFLPIKASSTKLFIIPKEDATFKITSDDQVCETTKFIN